MKKFLNNIRKVEKRLSLKKMAINSLLIFLGGVGLGFVSKWLDSRVFGVGFLDYLDLGNFFSDFAIWLLFALLISVYSASPKRASVNVFLFFAGMVASYHLYTVLFSGFNPRSYMMIWYGLTAVSPALAFVCWYAKSKSGYAIVIDSVIIFVMLAACFGIGMWYVDMKGVLYLITFVASMAAIFKDIKNISISFVIGLILAFLIRIPVISG